MTEITREADIRLEVMSHGCRRKAKREKRQIMSNWSGRRKKKK